jgi:hypothetical protein
LIRLMFLQTCVLVLLIGTLSEDEEGLQKT